MTGSPGDNRAYHGDMEGPIDFGALLPQYVRSVLVAGNSIEETARHLSGRPQTTLYGYTSRTDDHVAEIPGLAATIPMGCEPFPLPDGYLDAIVCVSSPYPPDDLCDLVQPIAPALADDGVILGLIRATENESPEAALQAFGWQTHHEWPLSHDGATLFTAYRTNYNPRSHAARLARNGRPDWAYDILYLLPERYIDDAATRAAIAAESLDYLRAIPPTHDWPRRLARFARAQWLFSCAAPQLIRNATLVDAFTAICDETGQRDLALRVKNTVAALEGKEPAAPRPSLESTQREGASREEIFPNKIRRVLMIMRKQIDYGHDVLYDGLCSLLGDENVTDYPWKAHLHGAAAPANEGDYPCTFQRGGEAATHEQVRETVRRGGYDLILFADTDHGLERDQVLDILGANPDTPVAILDQDDTPTDSYAEICAYLGNRNCCAAFKREYLENVPYHPRVIPLPFAYPEGRIQALDDSPRAIPLSWAGNRKVWLRDVFITALERQLSTAFNDKNTQATYSALLRQTQIAPAFFGAGFDTVRYWEVPAHGAMLLAERSPILIANNFVDGVHAVFFDDLADLMDKLDYYREHPDRCVEIARAGHEHLRQFHTGTARARFLLSRVSERLDT